MQIYVNITELQFNIIYQYFLYSIFNYFNVSVFRDLETACTLLGSPNVPLNLGNSGLLSQDPAYEKLPLYTELSKSYRWFDKVSQLILLGFNLLYHYYY